MAHDNHLTIHLGRLEANFQAIARMVGPACSILAVLKADGYGLGAAPLAQRLMQAGTRQLVVYTLDQARPLLEACPTAGLLVLRPIEDFSLQDPILQQAAAGGRLMFVLHGRGQLGAIQSLGRRLGAPIGVHMELDTGMNRAGLSLQEAAEALGDVAGMPEVRLAGLFTHPSSADDDPAFTDLQLTRLTRFFDENQSRIGPGVIRHFAATSAALRDSRYHLQAVRVGLGLLGYGYEEMMEPIALTNRPQLQPVVRLTSRIALVRSVEAGQGVGYNQMFTTRRPSRLAVVPLGYADGYPVALSNRGIVRVGPGLTPAPQVGFVCMDQIIIDVTDLPEAAPGMEVELISDDPKAPNALHQLARLSGTITYELLCRLSSRLARRYDQTPVEPRLASTPTLTGSAASVTPTPRPLLRTS